jgi:hypothetical protein
MRRFALAPACLLVLACKRAPSREEELARTQAEVTQTLAEVQPSYDRLRALRSRVSTPTPPCTAPADPALVRITWDLLRVLTGDPVDAQGHAEGELALHVPAPPVWDDRRLREMGSPTQPRTTPLEKGAARQQLLEGHALLQSAPGFLITYTEKYVPPDAAKPKGEWPGGRMEGRAVVLDKDAVPKCHYRFAAETPKPATDDPVGALGAAAGRALDLAVAMKLSEDVAPASP